MLAAALLLFLTGLLSRDLLEPLSAAVSPATAYLIFGLAGGAAVLLPAIVLIAKDDCTLVVPQGKHAPKGYFAVLAVFSSAVLVLADSVQSMFFSGGRSQSAVAGAMADPSTSLTLYVAFALLPAICEEILLRKAVTGKLLQHLGAGKTIVLTALFFALMHGSLQNLIPPLLIGLILGYSVVISGALWPALLIHICCNTYSFLFELMLASSVTGNSRLLLFLVNLVILLWSLYLALGFWKRRYQDVTVPRYEGRLTILGALRKSRVSTIGLFLILALYAVRVMIL